MKNLPANPIRGLIGLIGIGFMIVGAGVLWGSGGAMFVGGLYVAIDLSSDEIVERITRTTRGKE